VKKLSCSAKENQIYLVVNLLEKYEDSLSGDILLYNTDVVFDREGEIIARLVNSEN